MLQWAHCGFRQLVLPTVTSKYTQAGPETQISVSKAGKNKNKAGNSDSNMKSSLNKRMHAVMPAYIYTWKAS